MTISPKKPRSFAHSTTFCCLCLAATLLVMMSFLSVESVWYSIALEDLLVNQGIMSVSDQPVLAKQSIDLGKKLMAAHSVTIMGVGKESADNLHSVLKQIEILGKMFASSRVILIDGDSTDGSTRMLQEWVDSSPNNRTLKVVKAPLLEPTGPFAGKLLFPREGRISQARNTALDLLATMPPTNYVIMVDLDIVGWSQLGVIDSFGRPSWDGMCSNGVLLAGLFRDTYAFRQNGRSTNHHLHGDDAVLFNLSASSRSSFTQAVTTAKRQTQALMSEITKPMEVESCFGGLAIYRSEAIGSCRYNHRHRADDYDGQHPMGMVDCEHVLFNRCVSKVNGGRLFVNPHMKLWYGHTSPKDLFRYDRVKNSIVDFIFH